MTLQRRGGAPWESAADLWSFPLAKFKVKDVSEIAETFFVEQDFIIKKPRCQ
jgi:hypothetical protein